jgi:hypothetical protein
LSFGSGTLLAVNIGKPEQITVGRSVPATVLVLDRIMAQPHEQWACLRVLPKTCPEQNEQFCAIKAKGKKRGIPIAKPDRRGFRNLPGTRANLAPAIQRKRNNA